MLLRYPSPVTRIFIIALLIVLLPLRGWTAERMAEHMATNGGPASHAVGAAPGAMSADCPMLMQIAAKAGAPDTASTDDSGATSTPTERSCQSCQLCMSLAAHDVPAVQAVCPAPQTLAVHRADRFASADLPLFSKPPIS